MSSGYRWFWENEGKADATANGLTFAEVIEALEDDRRVDFWRDGNELVTFYTEVAPRRVLRVICYRKDRMSPVMRIIGARLLNDNELRQWKER